MKVIINGIEYPYVPGSVSISDRLNSRSTAQATILHGTSTHFSRGTQVTIKDDYDNTKFYGFISPRESIEQDMQTLRTELDCVDAHYLVDKRTITATYTSQAAGTTVSAIITAVLAAEGITAGTIEAGPTLPLLEFQSTKCSSALQDMAEAISFIWWVDTNKQLHFRLPGSQAAPWDLVWENIRVGTLKVTKESPEYKNRVRVRSASSSVVSNNTTEQTRLAAIESSSGIVEDVLEGPGYGSDDAAQDAADGVIDGYAVEETVIEFETQKGGLGIGQTLTVRLPEHGLDGTAFLIMSVDMHEEKALDTHGITYRVRAVVGPTSMAWANRIGRLVSRGEAAARLYDSFVVNPVQVITSTSVVTKPAAATMIEYHIWAAGGGGGGGGRYIFSNIAQGGGGGGQGGYTHGIIPASSVGDTFDVIVGTGGAGGAGWASASSAGNDGSAGGDSQFMHFLALGGRGGKGGGVGTGQTAAIDAGAATSYGVTVVGATPGQGNSNPTLGSPSTQTCQALPCPGAAGRGCDAGGTVGSTNPGGIWNSTYSSWNVSTYPSKSHRAASSGAGATQVTDLYGGGGGAGGKATQGSSNAENGFAGGYPGGGGGGGGAAASTGSLGSSGNGAAGGNGLVVIIAY